MLFIAVFFSILLQLLGQSVQYRTGYACEGSSLTISCDEPSRISLIRANFGRFSISICNQHGNVDWSVNCFSSKTSPLIRENCNGKPFCLLPASSEFFGDPCPGSHKYLEVHYECVTKLTKSSSSNRGDLSNSTRHLGSNSGSFLPKNQSPPPIIIPTINPLLRIPNVNSSSFSNYDDSATSSLGHFSSFASRASPFSINASNEAYNKLPPTGMFISSNTSSHTFASGTSMMSAGGTNSDRGKFSSGNGDMSSSPHNLHHHQNRQTNSFSNEKAKSDDGQTIYVPHPYPRPLNVDSGKEGEKSVLDTAIRNRDFHSFDGGHPKPDGELIPNQNNRALDESLHQNFCLADKQRDLWWNYTPVGQFASQPCPGGSKGEAKWHCFLQNGSPQWVPPKPDFSDCISLWMVNLESRLSKGDALIGIASELEQKIRTYTLYGGDIFRATEVIHDLVRRTDTKIAEFSDQWKRNQIIKELLISVQDACSNLLRKNHQDSWLELRPNSRKEAATTLVYSLEKNSLLLADTKSEASDFVRAHDYIYLALHTRDARDLLDTGSFLSLPLPPDAVDSETSLDSAYYHHFYGNSIDLSSDAIYQLGISTGLVRVLMVMFKRLDTVLEPEYDTPSSESTSSDNSVFKILNSDIIGAHLSPSGAEIEPSIRAFRSGSTWVIVAFRHLLTQNVTNPRCVHWDRTKLNWSDSGTSITSTNGTHTVCKYDHLGYFGLIMDHIEAPSGWFSGGHHMSSNFEDESTIQFLLILGSVINSILLLIGFITILLIFPSSSEESSSIHINVIINLLLNQLILLLIFGTHHHRSDPSRSSCGRSLAILLALFYYFLLVHFVWVLVDLIELYLKLVHRQSYNHSHHIRQLPLTHFIQHSLSHQNPSNGALISLPVILHGKRIRRCFYSAIYLIPLLIILFLSSPSSMANMCQTGSRSHLASFVIVTSVILGFIGLLLVCYIHRNIRNNCCRYPSTLVGTSSTNANAMVSSPASSVPVASSDVLVANLAAIDGDKYRLDCVMNKKLRISLFFRCFLTLLSATFCTFSAVFLAYNVPMIGYLYSFTNVLLGLFIFIYYCLCKDRVRVNYLRVLNQLSQLFCCWKNSGKSVYMNQNTNLHPPSLWVGQSHPATLSLRNTSITNPSSEIAQQPIINISSSSGSINPDCQASKHYHTSEEPNSSAVDRNASGCIINPNNRHVDSETGSDYGCRRLQAPYSNSHRLYHLYNSKQLCNPYACHHMIEHVYECIDGEDPYVAKVLLAPGASSSGNYRVHHFPRRLIPNSPSSGHHKNIHSLAYHNIDQLRYASSITPKTNSTITQGSNSDLTVASMGITAGVPIIGCMVPISPSSTQLTNKKVISQGNELVCKLPAIISDNNGSHSLVPDGSTKPVQNSSSIGNCDPSGLHPSMVTVLSGDRIKTVLQQGVNI